MADVTRGLGITGYFDPAFEEEFELLAAEWFVQTGFQLKEGKPEDDILRAVTERVTNKYLRFKPGDNKLAGLWQAVKDAFYAGYKETAQGLAMELLAGYRNLEKSAATNATGHVVFTGPNGTTIPVGTEIQKFNNAELKYFTDREVTIGSSGIVAAPVTAENTGTDYNTPSKTLTVMGSVINNVTVDNPNMEEDYILGPSPADEFLTLANDALTTNYQLVATSVLAYPVNVEQVSFYFRNPDDVDRVYDLQVLMYDHATGILLGRSAVSRVVLNSLVETKVDFIGLDVDVQPYTNVRYAIVNHRTSETDVELGVKNVASNGLWYTNSVNDSDYDAMMEIKTSTNGDLDNGLDPQSTEQLKRQYDNVLHNAAGFLPNGLYSRMFMLDGMRGVGVYPNPSNEDREVAPGLTVAANRVAVVVDASTDPDFIAYVIAKAGCGILSDGDVVRLVDGAGDHQEEVRFYWAEKEYIRVEVEVVRSDAFNTDEGDDDKVRDAIVEYIGGFNSQGTIKSGLNVGESISHLDIAHAVKENVDGVVDAVIKIGIDGNALASVGIPIDAIKKPFTTPALIQVI